MSTWKYSTKEVAPEELRRSLEALQKACLRCGEDKHSDSCTIALATSDIRELLELESAEQT